MRYLLILLLSGCTTIDYSNRVEGWPQLGEPDVRRVSAGEMRSNCAPYSPWYEFMLACSEVWFKPPRCRIWVVEGDTESELHERAHCDGYDHPGSTRMARILRENR